ncbi:MAG: hypothetical protein DMF61_22560 [Blastocatellia bacterium AA13]|nr:MAG: hypothetical protein DMF61_22560 [Blastocatellia bacterium AA13]
MSDSGKKLAAGAAALTVLLGAFLAVASQRLADVPVYETDESYILQVSYEVLNRGKLALPMYRYLGGNIENVWHSLTPLYFALLSGFLKITGFGVLQGRIFNLITVAATFALVCLVGWKLFNFRAGLIAVALLISDQTVFERARLLRNDYAAEAFALLAFFLYELAERRKSGRLFIAAGLAGGAGVMCHSSIVYMLAAICLLMFVRRGFAVFKTANLYKFACAALAVIAYELVYIAFDFTNFKLQYRDDNLHFEVFSPLGWWYNLLDEPRRYVRWYNAYDVAFPNVPRTLLHLFQMLAVAGVVCLGIRLIRWLREENRTDEPRIRLFIVTMCSALFFAVIAHKAGYYNAHLVTWYSLCAGVFLCDVWERFYRRISTRIAPARTTLIRLTVFSFVVLAWTGLLTRQYVRYSREARNPDLASFAEMQSVLKSIIPESLCPAAVKAPVFWLAFIDKDRCFATIERRMADAVDIEGKEYALIVRPKNPDYWARDLDQSFHLLGKIYDTPYGNFQIYYTGSDPILRTAPADNYYFFQRWRGHVSQAQIDAARIAWQADANFLEERAHANSSVNGIQEIDSINLRSGAAYQIAVDVSRLSADVDLVVSDANGVWLKEISLKASNDAQHSEDVFRTLGDGRVALSIRRLGGSLSPPMTISNLLIREIAAL